MRGVRVGGEDSEDTRLFNVFVENSGLFDLPLMGRKYTWVQPNGRCMSRLDRVLVSSSWLEEWGQVSLWGLKHDVSDHCPSIVKYNGYDWGPKTFRSMEAKIEDLTEDIETLELKGEWEGLSELELVRKDKFNHLWLGVLAVRFVNFSKSRLIGIKVASCFLEEAENFLNCTIGSLRFVYLGLPIGANLRLSSTWDPVIKTIEKRLSSWKNRYVSFGGRVVLINSVLSSIPIFYLSFLKLPSKVRKTIVRIQRNFLWGGASGVMDRIPEDDLLWKRVLEARYGVVACSKLTIGRSNNFSIWWKDLVGLGKERGRVGDWILDVFKKKLGNGGSTRFWLDHWVGVAPLKEVFPRLYSIYLQMDLTIQEVGEWVNALLGRLATRDNLARRGIIPLGVGTRCPWCDGDIESENHLLVTCPLAWAVWSLVHKWFGGVLLVWHAVVWALWRVMNDNIFSEKVVGAEELFDKVQITSWKWLVAKKTKAPCLFYEWRVNPIDCIAR
ncbi:hypothetical protein TSUD_365080 [Trifolium subterraneum]|uniref:Reverse transcriptase zinc-binding domain-containing protein n=1 Tax=Trifolium subterraneum TaxID=3900 RepID=A0A2Z6N989_TRISU|nr:hypothetical protein TSUD_365080 [Trifolium subterraneum]